MDLMVELSLDGIIQAEYFRRNCLGDAKDYNRKRQSFRSLIWYILDQSQQLKK